ncbi:hypothetical protein ID866_3343 [Astraeus odoratus]|nr:hypothetical protein ID866_3343 [Astraeus odoratus]
MQQKGYVADSAAAIAQYFEKATLPTQQETLGQVVVEILSDGRNLNRKSLCTKLDADKLTDQLIGEATLEATRDVVQADVIRKTLEIVVGYTMDDV